MDKSPKTLHLNLARNSSDGPFVVICLISLILRGVRGILAGRQSSSFVAVYFFSFVFSSLLCCVFPGEWPLCSTVLADNLWQETQTQPPVLPTLKHTRNTLKTNTKTYGKHVGWISQRVNSFKKKSWFS